MACTIYTTHLSFEWHNNNDLMNNQCEVCVVYSDE